MPPNPLSTGEAVALSFFRQTRREIDRYWMAKRPQKKAPGPQGTLEFNVEYRAAPTAAAIKFTMPERSMLRLGGTPFQDYLRVHQAWALDLTTMLGTLEWSGFEKAYEPKGRKPYHPSVMIGLILYGLIINRSSLRELELAGRTDIGAMWICGGLQPDHASIGRFLKRHTQLLTTEFFVDVTKRIAKARKLTIGTVAIDGTVVEAVSARFGALKHEALKSRVVEKTAASEASPSDDNDAALTAAKQALEIAEDRIKNRVGKGKSADAILVHPLEPEAAYQPLKNRLRRPSYKPSIIVHDSGLIVGQHLHPTSETAVVVDLLDQHEAVMGGAPKTLLADSAYSAIAILVVAVERNIDILAPEGRAVDKATHARSTNSVFPKRLFVYDDATNTFQCPAKKTLTVEERSKTWTRYRCAECNDCPNRQQCTPKSKNGRTIKRYVGEELKEGMRTVFEQRAAREAYRRRPAIVERHFGGLKAALPRFRRRGIAGARLELALYCIAANLKAAFAVFLVAYFPETDADRAPAPPRIIVICVWARVQA